LLFTFLIVSVFLQGMHCLARDLQTQEAEFILIDRIFLFPSLITVLVLFNCSVLSGWQNWA